MMASNVSILDTEVAQAIVLLGIEGRLVEVGGRIGGPGERTLSSDVPWIRPSLLKIVSPCRARG